MGKDLKGKELGAGINQKPHGSYQARYVDRFGERRSIYNKNLTELKRELERLKYEKKMGLNVINDKMTLNEWYKKWIEIHKFNTICLNTKRYYEQVYVKHIAPSLGKRKLNSITQLMIKRLLKDLSQKGLKFETQNKVRILLLDMFDKALIDNYVRRNPAKGIRLVRNEKVDRKVLTVEEQAEFFECSKGTFYDNLFMVAITSGLRIGEIAALTWSDIDLEKKEISISKSLLYQKLDGDDKKTFHLGNTKTKSSVRKVPINRQCELALKKQAMLKKVIASRSIKDTPKEFKDLLFVTRYNTPINTQICTDAIKRIVDEINLRKHDLEQMEYFSSHTFRHTFATRCFEAGIKPKTVQQFLGHATLQMTMDLYTHLLDDHKTSEMLKLEEALGRTFDLLEVEIDHQSENKSNDNIECRVIRFPG